MDERRLAMRKEHTSAKPADPLMEWLMAHDCLLYLPLSQNDTSDRISGNPMQKYAADSAAWDDSTGMWKFTYVSAQPTGASSYYALWNLKEVVEPQPLTLTCLAEYHAYSDNNADNASNTVWDLYPARSGFSLYGTRNATSLSAQVFAVENGVSVQRQYRNGAEVMNYPYTRVLQFSRTTGFRVGVTQYASHRMTYGLRNVALLKRGLSLAEADEYFTLIQAQ